MWICLWTSEKHWIFFRTFLVLQIKSSLIWTANLHRKYLLVRYWVNKLRVCNALSYYCSYTKFNWPRNACQSTELYLKTVGTLDNSTENFVPGRYFLFVRSSAIREVQVGATLCTNISGKLLGMSQIESISHTLLYNITEIYAAKL